MPSPGLIANTCSLFATALIGIALPLVIASAAPVPKGAPKKESPIAGKWKPDADITITFKDDGTLIFDDGVSAEKGWYRQNAKADPPEIDYADPARANPANNRRPWLGIYRIEGDTLTIYMRDSERPKKFETLNTPRLAVITMKRVKD